MKRLCPIMSVLCLWASYGLADGNRSRETQADPHVNHSASAPSSEEARLNEKGCPSCGPRKSGGAPEDGLRKSGFRPEELESLVLVDEGDKQDQAGQNSTEKAKQTTLKKIREMHCQDLAKEVKGAEHKELLETFRKEYYQGAPLAAQSIETIKKAVDTKIEQCADVNKRALQDHSTHAGNESHADHPRDSNGAGHSGHGSNVGDLDGAHGSHAFSNDHSYGDSATHSGHAGHDTEAGGADHDMHMGGMSAGGGMNMGGMSMGMPGMGHMGMSGMDLGGMSMDMPGLSMGSMGMGGFVVPQYTPIYSLISGYHLMPAPSYSVLPQATIFGGGTGIGGMSMGGGMGFGMGGGGMFMGH